MILGIGGAVALMFIAAGLSYAVRGAVEWFVMLPAAFGAIFHFLGCLLFVNYFKTLDKNAEALPGDSDEQ